MYWTMMLNKLLWCRAVSLICWSSNHSKVNKNGIPLYGRCSKHRLTIKSLKWTAISYSIFHANTQDGWIWGLTVHILFDMESVCQNECFYITDETENRLSTKTFNYVKKKKRCKRPILHNVDDAEQKKKNKAHWKWLICSICIRIAKCV